MSDEQEPTFHPEHEREAIRLICDALSPCQRWEADALFRGRWCGDLDEVAGLRVLGIQDDALGVTPLGETVVWALRLDWREKEARGISYRWSAS